MDMLKSSDLSVGDWVSFDTAYLTVEGDDIATAFVKKVQQPARIKSILGDQDLIFAEVENEDDFCTIYLKMEHIRPILITPEILEANGLYRHEIDEDNPQLVVLSNYFMMSRTYDDVEWWRVLIYDEEILSEELFNGIVYSVHQLQHAIRLAGVDKEIYL